MNCIEPSPQWLRAMVVHEMGPSEQRLIAVEIWPAIDLLNGKCVRLQQGDYERETIFSDRPASIAEQWFDAGASYLHCVDLDGAKTGSIINETAIREIVEVAQRRPVQLGGGVRDEQTIERLLNLGLKRLVVGTAALKDPQWFGNMCQRYCGHLVLGVDAKNGYVATQGWLDVSNTPAISLINQVAQHTDACVAVVYTDIARDGMLEGPNLEALREVQQACPFPVIASGGVTTIEDIRSLIRQKTKATIIGRALYEGRLDLVQALRSALEGEVEA